jgi:2-haloalkanoic acid dehalogenase type II
MFPHMRRKYLTFDCYGTLIDWRKGIIDNFKKFANFENSQNLDLFNRYVLLEAKNETSYSTYSRVLASTFLSLARELNLNPSDRQANAFAGSITRWPAFSDTKPTLKSLGEKGYKRIILSNIDRELLSETIRQNELEVDGYITAEDVKSYKPQKGHWIELLKRYDISRDDVIHIAGSIYHDIIPASEIGFKTIWVNRYGDQAKFSVVPTFSVNSLSEVLTIL